MVIGSLHPEGLEVRSRDSSLYAALFVLRVFYLRLQLSSTPRSSMIPPKTRRNEEIIQRYLAGERAVDLADEFEISVRRMNRIIRRFQDRLG